MPVTTREKWCIGITIFVTASCTIWFTLAAIAFEQDRTVYYPYQPGWVERHQTLIGGILAAFGGLTAIAGAIAAAYGQIRAAEITSNNRILEMRLQFDNDERLEANASRAKRAECRGRAQQWAAQTLGKLEREIDRVAEKINENMPRIDFRGAMSTHNVLHMASRLEPAFGIYDPKHFEPNEREALSRVANRCTIAIGHLDKLRQPESKRGDDASLRQSLHALASEIRAAAEAVRLIKALDTES